MGLSVDLVVEGDDGSVVHAQLSHEGSSVLLGSVGSEHIPLEPQPGPSWVYLVVDEVEPHFARVVAAGADVVEPVRNEDHGGRGYTVRDPEGNLWSVGSYHPEARPAARGGDESQPRRPGRVDGETIREESP
jgi:uncharacterized glyoxalase superfamily protein PhnB